MQEEKSFLNEIDWSMSLIDRFFCATLVAETQQILARARLVRRSINDWRASAEFLQVCLAERSISFFWGSNPGASSLPCTWTKTM